MRVRSAYLLLGLISLLMVADFVLRGIVPAFEPGKTDFSEIYSSAWLWRHGQNPYDSVLATTAQERLVGVSVLIAPIYPPTTLALISPFTLLPWKWADFVWMLLGSAGVVATIFLLLRLRGSKAWGLDTMAFVTFLLCFDPLHQAFHLGNVALLVVPLSLWAIVIAEKGEDWWAGVILGIAGCLKPQIVVWILLYYLLRRRNHVFFGACAAAALVAAALLLRPLPVLATLASYRANLQHWFAPGRPYGFTEGALPFHVNIIQVILYQLLHSAFAANLIAHAIFLIGLVLWISILWHTGFRVPAPLAISSLLALSFLSLYHSVSDTTILTLALCWAIPAARQPWTSLKLLICVIMLLLMLPGHSALMRLSPHLNSSIVTTWWWNLLVARYFVWLLSLLNVSLLVALWKSAASRQRCEEENARVAPALATTSPLG